MRLWFSASSEVPIYKQLATQVTLAILSGELEPGERLPSTRELARRFALHANTISAGYQALERGGWTERRKGSGVYVRRQIEPGHTPEEMLDRHIAGFFRAVRELQLPEAEVRARVALWLAAPRADHFLVIDPDAQLREILLTEIRSASSFPVKAVALNEFRPALLEGAVPLCRPSKTATVRALLPVGVELVTLQIRSANAWLNPWLPAPQDALVAVVSHWPDFLEIARTMLVAAGLAPEAVLLRDARKPGWRQGLGQAAGILTDAYTASLGPMPRGPRCIVFSLLADEARAQLAAYPARHVV